jgi:hypothetical protein
MGRRASKAETRLIQRALEDLAAAERLLPQLDIEIEPPAHVLRAADVCLEVAQWRLRGVGGGSLPRA